MLKYGKVCSVFGHRNIDLCDLSMEELKDDFENLILYENVNTFLFGGFGDFDKLCHELVSELKQKYNHIKRIYCLSDERHLMATKCPKYIVKSDYEELIYLPLDYDFYYKRIYFRNCAMIDESDFVIFYIRHTEYSGAYKAYKYAVKKKKKIINI